VKNGGAIPPQYCSQTKKAERRARVFPGKVQVRGNTLIQNNMHRLFLHSLLSALVLACLLPLFSGCRKKVSVPAEAPAQIAIKSKPDAVPPAVVPEISDTHVSEPVEPATTPKAAAAPTSFDIGEESFRTRNYTKAARFFEDYLKKNPKSSNRDIALFRLGLSLALGDDSGKNMQRAEEYLKRLIAECPASPYRGAAEFILGLQTQVESLKADLKEKEAKIRLLSEELQKLKDIDLQRRPSRPSY
jgi:hypothetical protein